MDRQTMKDALDRLKKRHDENLLGDARDADYLLISLARYVLDELPGYQPQEMIEGPEIKVYDVPLANNPSDKQPKSNCNCDTCDLAYVCAESKKGKPVLSGMATALKLEKEAYSALAIRQRQRYIDQKAAQKEVDEAIERLAEFYPSNAHFELRVEIG